MNYRTKYKQHLVEVEGFPPIFADQFIQQFEDMSFAQHLRFDNEEKLDGLIQDGMLHLLVSLYIFEGKAHLFMN